MISRLRFVFLLCLISLVQAQEKCGESKYEDKNLSWTLLSKISFQAAIPFKIPEGMLCAGLKSSVSGELSQVSYKSSEGSIRVFNRKFFLGTKRTVIKSDDFMDSSLMKEPLPILSFKISDRVNFYNLTIEYINQLNPFDSLNKKNQRFVSFDLHLQKKERALFYPQNKALMIDRLLLEIDALFNVTSISLFNRQELISKLKTQDL